MNIKLLPQIIGVSKFLFLQTFVVSMLWAAETNAQKESIYDIRLSIQWNNVSIAEALSDIEKKTNFKFTFNTGEIDRTKTVKLRSEEKSLAQVLLFLAKKFQLKFQRVNDNIHMSRRIGSEKAVSENFNSDIQVSGKVSDENGEGLPGVSIVVKGSTIGTTTNSDGHYKLHVPEDAILAFSFVGYVKQEVVVENQTIIDITMIPDHKQLEEIVVVGFGTQKKESVVGAMSSVKPAELKIPSSNLTTALAGRISGVVSYQTSGEPGADNAQFFVRGVASFNNQNGPLILIDGVELTVDDLARLQPDDIESFSVLKDPTTTAIYGARGANGIILVTTKMGEAGPAKVSLRLENSFSQPVSELDLADPLTYMRLQNEAGRTRGDIPTYAEAQIAGVRDRKNPNVFPATDWYDELFKEFTTTQRANLNVRGGGQKVRYYVAGSFNKDNGILKVDPITNFNNNIDLKRYLLRSNINVDLHQNTEMIVRLHSTIDDYRGPLQGGNAIYNAAVRTSPTRFPAVFAPDSVNQNVPNILFGNSTEGRSGGFVRPGLSQQPVWFNPYAELQRGYVDRRRQLNLVQLEIKQKLDFITPGLSARFLGNANSTSQFENRRAYTPYYYEVGSVDPANAANYTLGVIGDGGDETLSLEPSGRENNSVLYMEAATNYYKTFADRHNVSGLLVMIAREFLDGNASSLQLSLPSRNIGVSGRFNYDYDNRYFAEFNFGYNGSERFAKNNRFGFFPSAGIGWLISNEPYFDSNLISRLKLRVSYGIVGNDKIGNSRRDRFFYLSEVNLNGGQGYLYGLNFSEGINGVSINRYANPQVTWELAEKFNLGVEMNLFNDVIQLRVDAFHEKRTNILQTRQDIPSTLGLQAPLQTNVGEVTAKGIDASADISHYINNDFWVTARGTFTYADNEFTVFEEPNYAAINASWRSRIGTNVSQATGFIAERLFVDDEEALHSPVQFGTPGVDYGGGDIKYKDLNGDGQITDLDRTQIGNPYIPKITYGFGFSAGYKKFDLSVFLQGLDQTSFFINPRIVSPFVNTLDQGGLGVTFRNGQLTNGTAGENALIKAFADDHWSEDNKNVYAQWPRLSDKFIENNNQTSTYWMRNGSFLRLKQVEIGFNALTNQDNKLGLSSLRIYVTGTNLYSWSKFKLWDPELKEQGLNYPLQRVINLGVQVGF
ncbi:TonB-dependent receptor [Fulvivirgaceae bacterium BMA12]|uniref:TonB-dependent receptor n=1 Tax=Agaribacillus aureus TaxID=3051825 RepID=A0ABT8LE75_9BACT|nr:TonB-dependent receptor [Fulvivirgaceae bacterium BMA12]